jgi:hypothetical protein
MFSQKYLHFAFLPLIGLVSMHFLLIDYLVDLQIFLLYEKMSRGKKIVKHPNEFVALDASSSAALR